MEDKQKTFEILEFEEVVEQLGEWMPMKHRDKTLWYFIFYHEIHN